MVWLLFWFFCSALFWIGFVPEYELSRTLAPPSWHHPFGFDTFGRDLLSIILRASFISVGFAAIAVSVSVALGTLFGITLALSSRRVQFAGQRILETFLAFPFLLVALGWAAIRGPGWETLFVALLIGTLPAFVRLVHVRTKELLNEEYVFAAHAMGAGSWIISTRHLTPALMSLTAIKLPGLFAQALLAEASLTFLGIGAPIGNDTWGSLLAQGKDYLIEAPHIAIGVGIPLVLTVLSLQLISERQTEKHFRRG